MHKQCFLCNHKQADKLAALCSLNDEQTKELKSIIQSYLDQIDMSIINPEAMGALWLRFRHYTGMDDPYKDIKHYYNMEVMKCCDELQRMIQESKDSFVTALKIAITGNLIDFSANHPFDMALLKEMLQDVLDKPLAIDDSAELRQDICKVSSLLYIGDNCGDIVLDKLFLQLIAKEYPSLHIRFVVRDCPIGNDITMVDAAQVHMEEVCEVISNGFPSMGVVLEKSSPEFQAYFQKADVIICKGQGNYEGLLPCDNDHLYFLFMSKCPIISKPLHIEDFSIVCMKRNLHLQQSSSTFTG